MKDNTTYVVEDEQDKNIKSHLASLDNNSSMANVSGYQTNAG